jgi:uncharacterized DUF497 family protein
MSYFDVIWDLEDDPDGNVRHIAEHGVTMEEVEEVLSDPDNSTEDSEGGEGKDRSITFGETAAGRYLAVVWETAVDDPLTIDPVTAYDAPRPRHKRR